MNIYVETNELENAIKNLENSKKNICVCKNLFSIEKIITINSIKYDFDILPASSYFQFSYDDGIFKDIVKIVYKSKDNTCMNFSKKINIIDEDMFNKIFEIATDKAKEEKRRFYSFSEENYFIDLKFKEEILKQVENKEEFCSRYELFKKEQTEKDKEAIDYLHLLQEKIVLLKTGELS
jgi:hypothetical protein